MTVKLSDQPQLDSLDSVPATCSLPTKWRIIPTMERPDIIGGLLDCSVVDESKAGRESGERECPSSPVVWRVCMSSILTLTLHSTGELRGQTIRRNVIFCM